MYVHFFNYYGPEAEELSIYTWTHNFVLIKSQSL